MNGINTCANTAIPAVKAAIPTVFTSDEASNGSFEAPYAANSIEQPAFSARYGISRIDSNLYPAMIAGYKCLFF